eukprot:XP_001704421.1 Hypothetical protein GL50803_9551 [Giardia lamblia ATCC 50803]
MQILRIGLDAIDSSLVTTYLTTVVAKILQDHTTRCLSTRVVTLQTMDS